MAFFKKSNLTKRTLTYIIIPLLTLTILSVLYQIYFISSNFKSQEDKHIKDIGNYITPSIALAMWNFQDENIKITVDNSVKYNRLNEIIVFDINGKTVYSNALIDEKLGSENKPVKNGIKKEFEVLYKKEKLGRIAIYYSYNTVDDIIAKFSTTQIIIYTIMFLTLITILYISLKSVVVKPINKMNIALKNLSEGEADLTQRLTKERDDEIGLGIDLFNKFIERIQELISGVKVGTDDVLVSANEISSGNDDLANRTNELAASITESATTMDQFTSSVKLNTDNSEDADRTLTEFNNEIQNKSSLIENVTKTMKEISDSSKEIDNIVSVINDISFQTNLLALNAAVEAARAGEAGRGFAVVASEVRILAGKTAESSKSIQDIIETNVASTNKGMGLVYETSEFFSKITDVMNSVVKKIGIITNGSREQNTGIEQIHITMGQMDNVSNQNSAFVEEMANTTKSLKSAAVDLQDLISKFKLI